MKHFLRFLPWLALLFALYYFGSTLVEHKHARKYTWSDAEGYYMYLPAIFLYDGFDDYPVRTTMQFYHWPGTEKFFTKYTYGVAAMELPFFFAAFISRTFQGFNPKDAHSEDYSVAILLAGCFYGALGLYFLSKFIRLHFKDEKIVVLSWLSLLLGTNLLFYITRAPGMSHVYSFFLVSVLFYLTPRLWEKPSYKNFILVGLLLGFIGLIRPTNVIIALFPMLYGVRSMKELDFSALKSLWEHRWKIIAALPFIILPWLPQFYYWHYMTGNWLLFAYEKEGFDFLFCPQIANVLFHVNNGLLLYTPFLLIPFFSIFPLFKGNRLNAWASLLVLILSTYIFGSWWSWWFGGAFSQRNYVELLPALALPMAYLWEKIWDLRWPWKKILAIAAIVIFCFYTVRLSIMYQPVWSDNKWALENFFVLLPKVFFLNQ